ncbi:MAG: FecCD family ABC transporter permease, partial [Actinomycetes bacterium]
MSTATTNRGDTDRIETHDKRRRRSRGLLLGGLVAAVVVLVIVALLSIFLGTRSIAPGQIFDTFFHYDDENTDHLVVWTLRVPRTLAGILVGVALGLAGAVMQGVARNPLADPGLLGVNAGAALSVVCAISIFGIGSAMG